VDGKEKHKTGIEKAIEPSGKASIRVNVEPMRERSP
jgi:hypothetical protein